MNTNPNDPKGAAGALKTPLGLIPPYAMEQTAWVHKLGSDKYGPYNWRKTGVCASTYVNAILRHLNAWRDGENLDPESGISHLAHVACSCNILMDADYCGTLQDDRNVTPPEAAKYRRKVEPVETPAEEPEQPVETEYRFLEIDELIEDGDEYYVWGSGWDVTNHNRHSPSKVAVANFYRRKDERKQECTCGRIKINHHTLGWICEDCEWHGEPY